MLRDAQRTDIEKFYGTPVKMFACERDGVTVAVGGFVRQANGRVFAHIDVSPGAHGVVWAARAALKSAVRPLYATCWMDRYPDAPRFLRMLGFAPTGEVHSDRRRVWVLR